MEAPMASDSGIESNPIPRRIPAPPPLRSAITSATVNIIEPPIKDNNVNVIPMILSASTTISKMAAEIRIPAPNEVKNNICCSPNFLYFAIKAPRNDVPPAKESKAITLRISRTSRDTILVQETISNNYCFTLYDANRKNL